MNPSSLEKLGRKSSGRTKKTQGREAITQDRPSNTEPVAVLAEHGDTAEGTPGRDDAAAEDPGGAPAGGVSDLVWRAKAGDRRAFDALLAESRPRAMAVALKVVRNVDDAEDAVQDAFVKVWRYIARFEGRASFTTWLHRIVMNASLDLLRRQACRPGTAEEQPSEGGAELGEAAIDQDQINTPEQQLQTAETGVLVRQALEALTPVHKQALALRELEDSSYDEIAAACACPVGTVMSRLHHARRRFAEVWQQTEGSTADAAMLAA